jgi:hypothetical protein
MRGFALIVLATLVVSTPSPAARTIRQGPAGATGAAAAPAPQSSRRARTMRAVVRAWSHRLNAGDNAGVAKLFALPSVIAQGSYVFRFETRAQLAEWHSGLPCSGRIVSIAIRGRSAIAVFRLGDRGKTRCDAPGTLVAARFEIADGRIVVWQQVPVPATQPESGNVA